MAWKLGDFAKKYGYTADESTSRLVAATLRAHRQNAEFDKHRAHPGQVDPRGQIFRAKTAFCRLRG